MTDSELAPHVVPLDRHKRFNLTQFHELTLASAESYLIKGLIPRAGLVVVWGPPKCGKSFWIFDLAMHVALGWEYRSRRVTAGPVIYCAFEGGDGFRARAEAFRQTQLAQDHEPIDFFLLAARVNLVVDQDRIIGAIRGRLGRKKPVCIVLDTLNRSLVGSESDDRDMAAYIGAADSIREAFGCVVIIVHHCGIDGKRPRGHSSLTGAVDAQLAIKRDGGNVVATVEWMKDGPEGAIIVSRLNALEIGADADGDAITSCVVVPVELTSVEAKSNRKLSDRNRLALAALAECLLEAGEAAPAAFQLPSGTMVIAIDKWREELFRRGVLERKDKNPRQSFKRLRETLLARHLIGQRDDLVWRADYEPQLGVAT